MNSVKMEAAATLKALQMALTKRKYKESKLIHHYDRRLQIAVNFILIA